MGDNHSHGAAVKLAPEAAAVLRRGLGELLTLSTGKAFGPLPSERYPLPLSMAVYGEVPEPARVRADVERLRAPDPVTALEPALVLLELIASGRPGCTAAVPDDGAFLSLAFGSKRLNGWAALLGDADAAETAAALGGRWQFRLIEGPDGPARLYVLVNMLCRYGFVYGRVPAGDSHAMGHFVEDFTPGVLLCRGALTDLELTLSLAAMKLGVPAVVPPGYPFPLGRRAEAGTLAELVECAAVFPNIRRLLEMPGLPRLPEWMDPALGKQEFAPAGVWGDSPESFYVFRKGPVPEPGRVSVTGAPTGPLGVIVTAEAEPLDAFDRQYIEARAAAAVAMVRGARARIDSGRLVVELAAGTELTPERLGQALLAAIRREFPRLGRLSAEVVLDAGQLAALAPAVRAERAERRAAMDAATEEGEAEFVTCVGCSPFAPDHVCILTPERHPQCGRPYGMIRTGALYGYDDMTNIHHRAPHAGMNSFGMAVRGECLDAAAGEWSGVNAAAERLTGGRTRRVRLHSLDGFPHTGCGCFNLILFRVEQPRQGIAVMDRKYAGRAPDGRSWRDLHYALAGKQAPGLAGCSASYLRSAKFLRAHGGWQSVVWVSPKVAALMGADLPAGVEVGREAK